MAAKSQSDFRAMLFASKLSKAPLAEASSSSGGGKPPAQQHKLFVTKLAWSTREEGLKSAFSPHGTVTEAKVIMDRQDPTRSRGFGFVSFATAEQMNAALHAMDGATIDGRTVLVRVEGQERAAGGGSALSLPAGPGGQSQAKSYEQAMEEAGGDASKIVGLVLPPSRPGAGADAAGAEGDGGSASSSSWNPRARMDGQVRKARKEAKRKDADSFGVVCAKEEAVQRVLSFVKEEGQREGDLRSRRMLDVLLISSFRQGFGHTSSAEGLKWQLKLVVREQVVFSAEEVREGLQLGDKAEVSVSYDGGFERKQMWEFYERLRSDVCRSSRKWRRRAQQAEAVRQGAAAEAATAALATTARVPSSSSTSSPAADAAPGGLGVGGGGVRQAFPTFAVHFG
jgi:hypothetical protein